ncbi:hypothetical protein FHU10_4374 [Serratia fonticola]|uniref:Uncharacterized protein n=1 Tax=Serratia fonticola TaxID=47917 RepID=A0A542D2E2_SERFO|nr:hypothetical protein FHU09_3329 [Serratia fonticola]TQI97237.1 hypothetical protein FHU11_2715 [Serratia fonticola]TVZ71733.1 hypothetical protein FHU10_4374 [Serratia fonticola]
MMGMLSDGLAEEIYTRMVVGEGLFVTAFLTLRAALKRVVSRCST